MKFNEFKRELEKRDLTAVFCFAITEVRFNYGYHDTVCIIHYDGFCETKDNMMIDPETLSIIAEYANTPTSERIPKVYNIIFRKHEEACYYNVLSRDSYGNIKETTATSYELSTDSSYFFTIKDIDTICKLFPQKADLIIKSVKEVILK
jgi:hypothetical protein